VNGARPQRPTTPVIAMSGLHAAQVEGHGDNSCGAGLFSEALQSGGIFRAWSVVRTLLENKRGFVTAGDQNKNIHTHPPAAAQLLSAIVDSSDDAIISKNLEGVITTWNKSAERLFGYTAEEAIGRTVAELLIPEDRQEEEPGILARLGKGERVDHFETIRKRKDGTLIDISLTISPVRDANGKVVGASKIARDLGDTRRGDRAHRLLSAIVDSSDDAIISKNLAGVITSWNRSAERLFGYKGDEAIGRTVAELLIPTDRQNEEPEILARLRKGERVDHFETIRKRKNGTLLHISLTISPIRDVRGNVVGASKIARDITDARRIQAALLESEARFRQLADSMPQLIWTARPDGHVDYYNERWYEFTGLGRMAFGDASWEGIIHPDDLQRTIETYRAAIKSGQPYSIEHRFRDRRAGGWRWFVSRALPILLHDGVVDKWFGSSTDIDTQKRVQEDLQRANQDLEQFAFSASHDLQEPLRSIKIYSELLKREFGDNLSPEAATYVNFLRSGATCMETLVRDLLAYTRVMSFEPPAQSFDANEALKLALSGLSGAVAESHARIRTEPLPSVPVHDTHLQQLFQNIVGNAIKYRSPDRVPEIAIRAEQRNGHWVFAVSDNGIGIDPEDKEYIFGLLKRLHTREEYTGTGIGLAICQRIVDRYKGRIWVESEPGKGSTFHFTLPV
jgi:PAS domain S-box-containing protein